MPETKQETKTLLPVKEDACRRKSITRLTHHPNPSDPLSVLRNPYYNKGTGFSQEEREKYGLFGLLPPKIETIEEQVSRCLLQCRDFTSDFQKFIYLCSLRERNITLFFRLVVDNLEEMMPLIYTPTVGEGCIRYSGQFRQAEGIYISWEHKGRVMEVLNNWRINSRDEVSFIVVTDGSRILGLGDLGANGIGIPIGKSALYVAAGGFHPATALPVVLDTGTNSEFIRNDELYVGSPSKRIPDEPFYSLIEEFMLGVQRRWPKCLVQFEDFSNDHAFKLLDLWRDKALCFNDDIQGTGCVIAAGFLTALGKRAPLDWDTAKILFLGSGAAGVGVATQIVRALTLKYGISTETAKNMFYMIDSKGLVNIHRGDTLPDFKVEFARKEENLFIKNIDEAVAKLKPFALIGLSTIPGAFNKTVLQHMATNNERPIIMPLSNPTAKSECTAQEAFDATGGKVLFASGSPFPPLKVGDKTVQPSQGNNLYTFPAIGFGSWLCGATKVSDGMLTAATVALASVSSGKDYHALYPPIKEIRTITARIATDVITCAVKEGLAQAEIPEDVHSWVLESMYFPGYIY